MSIWVLVADSSRARLLGTDSAHGELGEIQDFVHPESRVHEQKISSDLPGSRHGAGGLHHVDSQTGIKEQESIDFAKHLGRELNALRNRHKLDRLWIVAEPRFLGHLRQELDDEVSKLVSGEVDKDLLQHGIDDIRAHLPERL